MTDTDLDWGGTGSRLGAVPRRPGIWRRLGAYSGPGYLVAVGYMDPGNWATDIAGGARFGTTLLSVVVLSNVIATILQVLALRLGIATDRGLAETCRVRFSRPVVWLLWSTAELGIIACDLAELIGAAIALNLLFGISLVAGLLLTVLVVMQILWLQRYGFRVVEAVILALILVTAGCLACELAVAGPHVDTVLAGLLPRREIVHNPDMLYVAIGILGATVMPHNLYLHSAVVQTRAYSRDVAGRHEAIRFATADCAIALTGAVLVNAAILVLAATSFHGTAHEDVAGIAAAASLLTPLLGAAFAGPVFAVALLAAGQSATLTGTLAGQIVMEGFLGLRVSPAVRQFVTRLIAVVPAALVVAASGERGLERLLILSQVILSLQLSLAVVPLVLFTGDRQIMGAAVSPRWLRVTAWVIAGFIAGLNLLLVTEAIG